MAACAAPERRIAAGISTSGANTYQGIAPNANIISLRVLDKNGVGSTSALLNALNWILAPADPNKPASSGNPPGTAAGWAECVQTGPIGPGTLGRLSCDAVLTRVLLAPDGGVLNLGRGVRVASLAQRRALAARDRGCVIPGCTATPGMCDAHHVTWYRNGVVIPGQTNRTLLINTVDATTIGSYSLSAENRYGGSVTPDMEVLTDTPIFISQPRSQTFAYGGDVAFSAPRSMFDWSWKFMLASWPAAACWRWRSFS